MLMEKEIAVKAGEIDGHVGSNAETYEDQHGRYEYGFRIKEGKRILEFCAAMTMTVVEHTPQEVIKSPCHL